MSLHYKEIAERFFLLFPGKSQKEIAEIVFPGANPEKKQPQVSAWRTGREKVPWEVLERVVDLRLTGWGELLSGKPAANSRLADSVGGRLRDFLEARFPTYTFERRCEAIGSTPEEVRGWIEGSALITGEAVLRLIALGCDAHWLLEGKSDDMVAFALPEPESGGETGAERGENMEQAETRRLLSLIHDGRRALLDVQKDVVAHPPHGAGGHISFAIKALEQIVTALKAVPPPAQASRQDDRKARSR